MYRPWLPTLCRHPLAASLLLPLFVLTTASASAQAPVANLPVNADTGSVNQIGTIQITEAAGG